VWVALFAFLLVNGTFGSSLVAWSRQESVLGETLSPLVSPLLLGLFLLVLFNLPAFFLEFKRLHFIGFMFALPIPAGAVFRQFFGIELGFYAFLIPAAAVIVVGLVIFLRFLQQHPLHVITRGENGNVTS
jgi:predicted Na+-dependent transporter